MPKNNYNTSNNIENDPQSNFDSLLLDIMRERFPDVQAYQEGRLLQQPELPESEKPFEPESTLKVKGRYQINLDKMDESGNIVFKNSLIGSLQPTVAEEVLTDLIDDSFEFFVDEENEVGEPEDVADDKFIVMVDPKKFDLHNEFLQGNFPAVFLEKGKPKIYPNYKTLEVELTDKKLTYDDLEVATDSEIAKYNLYQLSDNSFRIGKMISDRTDVWSFVTRFESGYVPIAPFKRDPGDYFEGDGYQQTVYKDQTSLEFLRAKYEGKGVIYDVQYARDERQRLNTSEIESTGTALNTDTSTNPPTNTIVDNGNPNFNLNNVRIMIKGFWKRPVNSDSRVYRQYKEFQNLDTAITEDIKQSVERLILAGGIESLEAMDADNPSLNSQDLPLPVWNDFPHINSDIDELDIEEYKQYWESTNQGNPFDVEYMEPYEPEGSLKYFVAGETLALAEQAANSYQTLIAQNQSYYQATGPMQTLLDLANEGIGSAYQKIYSYNNNLVTTDEYKSQWDTLYWDIFHVFVNEENRINGSTNEHKLRRGGLFGGTRRSRNNLFGVTNKYASSRTPFNGGLQDLDINDRDGAKFIGARNKSDSLLLNSNGVRGSYGFGINANNRGTKSPYSQRTNLKEDLSRGLYNIYSEFDRYINLVSAGGSIQGVAEAVAQLETSLVTLKNKRAELFNYNVFEDEWEVDLDNLIYEEEYIAELDIVTQLVNTIEATNASISAADVSNSNGNVQNVFESMKKACYIKAYRMIDCARRKLIRDSNYSIRLSNRTVEIFQANIPELADVDLYFRSNGPGEFYRADIETLYNTELDYLQKSFITDGNLQVLDNEVENINNYASGFFNNPFAGAQG